MVRWRYASALRPSSSRLLPGAANKAQKAKKGEEKRAERYPAGIGLEVVERYVHAATVARHEDGDGAATMSIEQAHGAWRLRLRPPRLRRFAKNSRLREIVNASSPVNASRSAAPDKIGRLGAALCYASASHAGSPHSEP